jgi:NADH-quinone oxidoreductase subunit D
VTVAVGPGSDRADITLDLGDLHPTSHGGLRLKLALDGDVITTAEGLPGLMHRGAEKLFEARDYRQIIMLADRHDWHGAFGSEVGVALAVEQLAGISVPERATLLRTLLCEITRIQSTLIFAGVPLGANSALVLRERWLDHIETYTGNRVHPMICRVGGLAMDVTDDWLRATSQLVEATRESVEMLKRDLNDRSDSWRGVAILSAESASELGASGPAARASGLDVDLRRDDPYLAYDRMPLRVITKSAGDASARFEVLVEQIPVSLNIIDTCIDNLGSVSGPIDVRLPKVLRAPEGETYVWTENPTGINGYHLVSHGEPAPWRLKIRSGGFGNLQALAAALPGTAISDLAIAIASFALAAGDVDR